MVTYDSPSQYQKQLREQLQQSNNTVCQHTLKIFMTNTHMASCIMSETGYSCIAVLCQKVTAGNFIRHGNDCSLLRRSLYISKRLVVHYNRLEPYFFPFIKTYLEQAQFQCSSQNHHQEENTDQQSDTTISETTSLQNQHHVNRI